MPRRARIVVPGWAHHPPLHAGYGVTSITQRGNRRQDVFHCDSQRRRYLQLLGRYAAERGLVIRAYCLMTNQTASPRLCRPMHRPCGRGRRRCPVRPGGATWPAHPRPAPWPAEEEPPGRERRGHNWLASLFFPGISRCSDAAEAWATARR